MSKNRRLLIPLSALTIVGAFALAFALYRLTMPTVLSSTYRINGGDAQPFSPPLSLPDAPQGTIVVTMDVRMPLLAPHRYTVVPDDCLTDVRINGAPVPQPALPFCDYTKGRTMDVGASLAPGMNHVVATVRNDGSAAGLMIRPSWTDPRLVLLAATLLAALWLLIRFCLSLTKSFNTLPLSLLLFGGTAIRVLYLLATPHTERGHDWGGHYEYIEYLLHHFSLPDPTKGWEFYQPPLYYVMGAAVLALTAKLAFVTLSTYTQLQLLAVLCSIATLGLGAWIGTMLFPRKDERSSLFAFIGILAVVPGLVFFGARINNDVLYLLIAFAWMGQLLVWWRAPRLRHWIVLAVLVGLGLLTKTNAAVLAGISVLCLAAVRGLPWKRKILHGLILLAITLLMAGPFHLPRALRTHQASEVVVGNIGSLNGALRVRNTLDTYFTFDPLQMLAHPYNNAWDDRERRTYFYEYFFRSALFGEFQFGDQALFLARSLLGIALFFLPVMLVGLAFDLWQRRPFALPLAVTFVLLLAAHTAFRAKAPYRSSQDFRNSIVLLVPAAYYVARGIGLLPANMRRFCRDALHLFELLCVLFFVYIFTM